ncbi:MAG TPA: nucleotidyltransferase domain-containing protein [Spirochaetia bacterium]|nr:nucleotidyltransferase domain-containing protein [Spirochaetia bacterium]
MEIISYDIDTEQKEAYLQILSGDIMNRPEILFAYAHGSFLEDRRFRDLDVAVFLRPEFIAGKSPFYETELGSELQKDLKALFPVDIRILNTARLSFQYNAIKGRLLADRDPEARIAFITKTVSLYLDIKPILRHYTKEALEVNLDHDRIRRKLEDIDGSLQDLEEFSAQIGSFL